MKSAIYIVCFLVPLIILLVYINRKDFYTTDDAVVQEENLTGEENVSTLTMLKPIEKQVEKTGQTPVETKTIETKSVTDRQTDRQTETEYIQKQGQTSLSQKQELTAEEKLAPAAVPVVTAEGAKELNLLALEYAVAEEEKRKPFSRFYQNNRFETVCFEGTVRATSIIPDPEKNDYDNCLYALFIEIDSLLSDVSSNITIPSEVIINAPIMKDKIILQDNIFSPGDKVWCTCAEYEAMPQSIQEIQLSDNIQSYESPVYYPLGIRKISTFQKGGNRNFAKKEMTFFPLQVFPKDERAFILRKKRIHNEITRIDEEIKKHGGSFQTWKKEYNPFSEKYKKISEKNFKGWINDSYFAADLEEPFYDTPAYIDGLLPYKKYLEDNNIDLIIVRIPTKGEFARCVLSSDVFRDNPAWVEHYYNCLKNDIEIVDPMSAMWDHRFDYPLFYFYNEPSEVHPFEGQAFITAMVLSDILKRYSFPTSELKLGLEDYVYKTTDKRYFWPEGNQKFNPKDNINFKRVVRGDQPLGALTVNTGSPFLFLSNSLFAYPQRNQGASLPAYTSFFIQHVPDWFYQDGIGNPMLRNLIADRQALTNRKAVIMVGGSWCWRGTFPSFPKYVLGGTKSLSQEKTLDFLSPDITNLDDGSFVFSKDEDNITFFAQNAEKENASKSFSIELTIPYFEGKGTCMLRVNFGTNSYIDIVVRDSESKKQIDSTTLSFGTNQHSDLYIPMSQADQKISIQFSPIYPNRTFSIQNIELWYY